jgi:hypothetical protein
MKNKPSTFEPIEFFFEGAAAAIVARRSVARVTRHTPNRLPREGGTRVTSLNNSNNSNRNDEYEAILRR